MQLACDAVFEDEQFNVAQRHGKKDIKDFSYQDIINYYLVFTRSYN